MQLEDAICKVRDAQCTESKDKIFSALSLVPNGDGGLLFFPDYQLSAMEIQNMLAKSSMLEYRSLNVLRYVEHTTKKISMPLWAPRLTITKLSESWTEGKNHYEQDVKTEVSFKSQNNQSTEVLCMRSTIMLGVSRVSSGRVTSYGSSSPCWPRIGLEDDDVEAFKQHQVRRDTLPSTISGRRLVNDSFYGARSALDDDGDYSDPYESANLLIAWHGNRKPTLSAILRGRRGAITHAGIHAIVPEAAQRGDFVASFHGICLPFVVRLRRNLISIADFYVLIGACEVDADMDWMNFEEQKDCVKDVMIV